MTDEEKEELVRATMNARDRQLAEMVVLAIGLAAERHPELIRDALSKVFDLTAVEEHTKRMMALTITANESARESRYLLEQVHKEVDEIERRLDQTQYAIKELHKSLTRAKRRNKMIEFAKGPADGQVLNALRCPFFLRVTIDRQGKFDCLDQVHDTPDADETIYVYRRNSTVGSVHYDGVDKRGTRFGRTELYASYIFHDTQPGDAILRSNDAWATWAQAQLAFIKEPNNGKGTHPVQPSPSPGQTGDNAAE